MGSYFIRKNKGLRQNCWDHGCDYTGSLAVCQKGGGTLAKIRNRHDNQMIGRLLSSFNKVNPMFKGDYFWFYMGLRDVGEQHYMWEDGSKATYFNW